MGPHFTICCRAESSASMDDLPLWKYEDRVETYPTKDPAIAFSGQKAIQVEEPEPLVDLYLGASGPAFIGESFMAPVTVSSRGHDIYSGELKINLVDVRGGVLFSPRETESSSMDSHHVELIGIVGEDESQLGSEKFEKIQQSFGLVSVPFLKNGDLWSCKLEIKWHRPKPVMLFVSLGYSPLSDDLNAQKVNIHKSLPIEGVSAIAISHHFMLPFRRDPLLLSRIKPIHGSEQLASLPLNETSLLIVSAKNCTQVPLQLKSMSIENEVSESESSCSVQDGGNDLLRPALLVPGEEFKKVFTVVPKSVSSMCRLGTVCLRWKRDSESGDPSSFNIKEASVLSRHKLPDVKVELSPLVVSLECPPYAILGDPFTYMVKIQNQTQLLQEVKLSLADSQSFVLAGSHNDTVFILPKSEHILSYKIVPLASGSQPLPKVTVSSGRYSAGFQPSNTASTVFVFPLRPDFKMDDVGERRIESITSE